MGRTSISYINKDYESMRQELLTRIPQLTDRWTDVNPSDLGVVLLELFCGVGDMLAYYLDAQVAEAFLPTARQRQSVIDLCKLIGYRLDSVVSATTVVRFMLSAPLDADLMIPAGARCRALLKDGQVDFETIDDALVPHGQIFVDIPARQGIRKTEEFVSTGKPWQRYSLSGKSIAQGTIRVKNNDVDWNEVLHYQDSDAESLHFTSDTDALDVTTILFGDGNIGAVPQAGETIVVSWLESVGDKGNLAPGTIRQLLTTVYQDGSLLHLTINNPVAATGGTSQERLEHAKRCAPSELRSLWKSVTLQDFKSLAEGFPGVGKAQVLDTNDCRNIRYYNVHLVIAPSGGGMPSPVLKSDLATFIEQRKVITVEVNIFDPLYRPIPIDAEVYVYATDSLDIVRSRIENALHDFFAFDRVEFAQTLHSSDLIVLLDGIRGVSHVYLYTPQQDIVLDRGEIPVLGTVNLDMRRTG